MKERLPLLDIHTHDFTERASYLIYNPHEVSIPKMPESKIQKIYLSIGFHPWHLEKRYSEIAWKSFEKDSMDDAILAIGEAGLDKIKGAPMQLQIEAFEKQVDWAARIQKNIIIHNVRASEEVWHVLRPYKGKLQAIMHAFRRNKKVAKRFLDQGHYLSFGHPLLFDKNLQDVLRYIPINRLFLEIVCFAGVYIDVSFKNAAGKLQLSIEDVSLQVLDNFNTLFPKNTIDYDTSTMAF